MYAKGLYRDYIYVGYDDSSVFMYHIDLGTGRPKYNLFVNIITDEKYLVLLLSLKQVGRPANDVYFLLQIS